MAHAIPSITRSREILSGPSTGKQATVTLDGGKLRFAVAEQGEPVDLTKATLGAELIASLKTSVGAVTATADEKTALTALIAQLETDGTFEDGVATIVEAMTAMDAADPMDPTESGAQYAIQYAIQNAVLNAATTTVAQ